MTIIQQLAQLHQLAPDICQRDGDSFIIGTRYVWEYNGTLLVQVGKGIPPLTNQAALDLLQGALQRAIEARGCKIGLFILSSEKAIADVGRARRKATTPVEALLTVLLAVLENER